MKCTNGDSIWPKFENIINALITPPSLEIMINYFHRPKGVLCNHIEIIDKSHLGEGGGGLYVCFEMAETTYNFDVEWHIFQFLGKKLMT